MSELNFNKRWEGVHDRFLGDYVDEWPLGVVFLYVMCLSSTPFTKVGITRDVERRRRELSHPVSPSVRRLWVLPSRSYASRIEFRAHSILSKVKFEWEWFEASEATAIGAVDLAFLELGVLQ